MPINGFDPYAIMCIVFPAIGCIVLPLALVAGTALGGFVVTRAKGANQLPLSTKVLGFLLLFMAGCGVAWMLFSCVGVLLVILLPEGVITTGR
jgi:hypothetical protein